MTVEYRDVPGYPGIQAGSDASIWSCRARGQTGAYAPKRDGKWVKLTPHLDRSGYLRVRIGIGQRRKKVPVHVLVLLAFKGPRPEGMWARHYPDDTKTNCLPSNLIWGTPKENCRDRINAGTQIAPRLGEDSPLSKVTEPQAREMRRRGRAGENLSALAAEFGIEREEVRRIVRGQRWGWLPPEEELPMVKRSAVISECERFRYRLDREWDASLPKTCFVMLNPSTADGEDDDPTIRRCMGFARGWGRGGIVVANLFAWRATNPKELTRRPLGEIIGPDNDQAIIDACAGNFTVVAWGANAPLVRVDAALTLIRPNALAVECLGLTKKGMPKHPLFVPGAAKLMPYTRR